jgi:hypothetical protein
MEMLITRVSINIRRFSCKASVVFVRCQTKGNECIGIFLANHHILSSPPGWMRVFPYGQTKDGQTDRNDEANICFPFLIANTKKQNKFKQKTIIYFTSVNVNSRLRKNISVVRA